MRTETTTRNLYRYDELSEQAKETALQKFADINVNYDWWEEDYSDAETIGLLITGFDLDRNRHAHGKFLESAEECADKILKEHGGQCETFMDATNYLQERDRLINEWPKDENGELSDVYDLDCKLDDLDNEFLGLLLEDYSIMLQHEYEYRTSREAIEETIRCNEYEFTEKGELA